jgi:hypothetical protein
LDPEVSSPLPLSLSSPPLLSCARPIPRPLASAAPARGSPGARRGPSSAPLMRRRPLPQSPSAAWPLPCSPARRRGLIQPPRAATRPRPTRPLGRGSLAPRRAAPRPRRAATTPSERPLPPGSMVPDATPGVALSGARPLAPRGSPSTFPRAQPQRAWRSNLGLISF